MLSIPVSPELELRQTLPEEAPALFALVDRNRAWLRRWLPWVDGSRTVADTLAHLEDVDRRMDTGDIDLAIHWRGALVGKIGTHVIDQANRRTSLGYWLDEAHGGCGIMTAACRGLVRHLLEVRGMNRIEIMAATDNVRSRAIPERLGFTLEGVLRQREWLYDHYHDLALYALLAEDAPRALGDDRGPPGAQEG